jgi:hypothetical protein
MCSCGGHARRFSYKEFLIILQVFFLNFGLGTAFLLLFYFNPVSVYIMVSLLSLVCERMDICICVVNLLLLAPDDDPLRSKHVVCFYNNIHYNCWCVRRSYCLLPFDLSPQDACLQKSAVINLVRFQVLTVVSMKMTALWDIEQCRIVEVDCYL